MFGIARRIEREVKLAPSGPVQLTRMGTRVGGIALAVMLFGATSALAQNCGDASFTSGTTTFGVGPLAASPSSVSSAVASTLTTASTAFLLQSTAFIGSPPNPTPDQQGGGVWVRSVGGSVDVKSSSNSTLTSTFPPGSNAFISCTQKIHETFVGVQLGTDIARLNINGWNVHVGTTAGYIETRGNLVGGAASSFDFFANNFAGGNVGGGEFNTTTQIPFVGAYAAATYGGFFVDGLLRTEYYQTKLNAPGVNLFNQSIDAHGISFSGSMGYNWQIPNSNWFIEPSAGLIVSRLKVDPFNYVTAGTPGFSTFSGTLQMSDIKSDVGRVGLRVGTTVTTGNVIWQPFASVSAWREFGPSTTSSYTTCNDKGGGPGCVFFGSTPATFSSSTTTSTVGTFGQYSLGFASQLAGTGWLGFARVDYRNGPNLEGLSGTGGIRYQFTPEAIAQTRMPTKGPAIPIVTAVNWTGFYVGAFGGGVLGTADWNFAGGSASPHVGGYLWGGDIGYNYQFGQWVLGVEADFGKTNLNGGTACAPLLSGSNSADRNAAPMFQMTCNAWADWIATATARLGYSWGRTLYYVKGGGAWTNEQFSATCNLGPLNGTIRSQQCTNPAGAPSNGFTASNSRGGWTVGYGTEFALTRNWSAKAEYNYVSFGDRNVTASDGSLLNVGMHASEVKVGVNYRFDGGAVVY